MGMGGGQKTVDKEQVRLLKQQLPEQERMRRADKWKALLSWPDLSLSRPDPSPHCISANILRGCRG